MILTNDAGTALNATVETHELGLVLHSRSGTTRNRDYRAALELIMERLDNADINYEIYRDSSRVQNESLPDRRLSFDKQAPIARRFDLIVQAMNQGTPSHGAWRRLLIATPGVKLQSLPSIVGAKKAEPGASRLPSTELRKVRSEHIGRSVEFLLNGGDAPNFSSSRDYDAMTADGEPLAPKKVFGLALQEALGIEAFPAHFSSGWGQVSFDLLEKAGLWIVPKVVDAVRRPKAKPSKTQAELDHFIPTEEEKAWIEGNPKIVSHLVRERQPGLAKQKREEFVSKHGRLFCEDCRLDPVERYGKDAGTACIEVHHHRTHVADMQPGHVSVTDDLKCLCANCHRVLHRKLTLGLFA
ncbi:hypothetical protein GOB92_10415 [Sinorhizobium meliloti]|nr:hypothetical protein [Sinorhizobium meliloti]